MEWSAGDPGAWALLGVTVNLGGPSSGYRTVARHQSLCSLSMNDSVQRGPQQAHERF